MVEYNETKLIFSLFAHGLVIHLDNVIDLVDAITKDVENSPKDDVVNRLKKLRHDLNDV